MELKKKANQESALAGKFCAHFNKLVHCLVVKRFSEIFAFSFCSSFEHQSSASSKKTFSAFKNFMWHSEFFKNPLQPFDNPIIKENTDRYKERDKLNNTALLQVLGKLGKKQDQKMVTMMEISQVYFYTIPLVSPLHKYFVRIFFAHADHSRNQKRNAIFD